MNLHPIISTLFYHTMCSLFSGMFGFLFLGLMLIPLFYIKSEAFSPNTPYYRLEDPVDALKQIGNNHLILVAILGNLFVFSLN